MCYALFNFHHFLQEALEGPILDHTGSCGISIREERKVKTMETIEVEQ